ncbi:LysR family transcriptional regulator [Cognatishimia activa]|uniref:HTH-type transcriptional activator AllS n=1 Tax=Cognatishimia activa TaxID=1715691 RepID=A0A0P1J2P5_9RHOB|nr:LysR family transcriptional regulator [Cognatishimia activa]CUI35284.1 HTH-type transcriptional activator AllS [Cognatishimia activa]CUK24709.1 HTH-type transcriptional activator AllS [Cognatishimia activa]
MKTEPSLDDYALFIAIAETGSLTQAATTTGKSIATLSRRMTELESDMGQLLFQRGNSGYALTPEGANLLIELEDLRELQARLRRFRDKQPQRFVRVTTGHWACSFMSQRLPQVWSPESNWRPAFMTEDAQVDIARRQADIGIRNRRPDQNWLAGRKLATIHFAPFAVSEDTLGWVNRSENATMVPSQRWVYEHYGDKILATASDPRVLVELALSGIGQVILPIFAGREIPGLVQSGTVIDELSHENWMVFHQDGRHDPPIRAAIDALCTLLDLRQTER